MTRDLADIQVNNKAKNLTRPATYCWIGQVIMAHLDKYPWITAIVENQYLTSGLSVPVPTILMYFAVIVDRETEEVRHTIY